MKLCPFCAKEIQDQALKCKHCLEEWSEPWDELFNVAPGSEPDDAWKIPREQPVIYRGFSTYTEDEIKKWLWLRAVEWVSFPAFVTQPLVPIMFIFFPWYGVIAAVYLLGILWSLIRYFYVNVTIAMFASYMVIFTKCPSVIGSSIYLFLHHQPVPASIALIWPWLSGLAGVPGKIGVVELAFAKKTGFVPQDVEL